MTAKWSKAPHICIPDTLCGMVIIILSVRWFFYTMTILSFIMQGERGGSDRKGGPQGLRHNLRTTHKPKQGIGSTGITRKGNILTRRKE